MNARLGAVAAVLAVLAAPGTASAHGRSATVALDYRLRLAPASLPGVSLHVLDGDRSLEASVAPGVRLVVLGTLHEPVIRFSGGSVWVNGSSPTAQADGLTRVTHGWVKVRSARTYAWHDHRLAPPPLASARNAVPLALDGRDRTVDVFFTRVGRPPVWPWLAGGAGLVAALALALRYRAARSPLTVGLALAGGAAAAAASVGFALRDQPSGRPGWLQIGLTAAIAAGFAVLLARSGGRRRAHAAGVAGAVAAAATLGSLPVFWHGVVVSALPGSLARLGCGLALVCGAAAAGLSFLPDFDEPRRAAA